MTKRAAPSRATTADPTLLDEVIALKMLTRELADEPQMLSRSRLEVKLARRVTHPNVVRTFDIGEHQRWALLAMKHVDGEPVEYQRVRVGSLPSARVVAVGVARCEALAAAARAPGAQAPCSRHARCWRKAARRTSADRAATQRPT